MSPLFLSVLAAALIAPSWSQEDPTRQLQNLVYYPHARQSLLTSEFNVSLNDSGQTDDSSGMPTQMRDASYQTASLGLIYGAADGLRLGVSEGYLFDRNTQTTTVSTGKETSVSSNGFSDPSFSAAYRWLQSNPKGVYWDLDAAVTPAIGQKLSAVSGQTGNDLSGAWSATLSAPAYWLIEKNEFEAEPSVNHNFGGNVQGTSAANSTETSDYWTAALLLQDRFHCTRAFFIQPGITLNLPYSYSTASQVPGAASTGHQVGFYVTPSVVFGYLVSPRFLVEASISYNGTETDASPPSGNDTEAPNSQTVASLLARLAFP
jgi:hypothetical protein